MSEITLDLSSAPINEVNNEDAGRIRSYASSVESRGAYGAADVLRWIADQIEVQVRIPEPGKYGVVRDKHGVEWVTYGQGRWVQLDKGLRDWPWADIEGPILVREGVDDDGLDS